jgi:Fe-S-cluster containining protein
VKPLDHLVRLAKAYEARKVIPHCPSCQQPCCGLKTVVLDMTWKQAQHLYQIKSTRAQLVQMLHEGEAPPHLQEHLKESHGKFFAHGAACPAFDQKGKGCNVYGTEYKPTACGEFPLYADGDALTVDLRCEAVSLEELDDELAQVKGTLTRHANEQFPFLITYELKPKTRR